jgi:carbamoyl-phosphate synthase/aspartate carbamoyltransferase
MATNSLISVLELTRDDIIYYISKAEQMKIIGPKRQFPNKTVINMFYEPSTRTSCSFQVAAIKLGCKFISLTDKLSSVEKGESLEDTIKTLNCYGDAIVLRHPLKGSSERAKQSSKIPIINAGDGNGEHPTQALLDIFTIYDELSSFGINLYSEERDEIVITFLGDLKNSRTIHSLIHVLALFPKMKFIYISPSSLEIPIEIFNKLNSLPNCQQIIMESLKNAISLTDVLYVTRIQKERFTSENEYYSVVLNKCHQEKYCVDKEIMQNAKDKMLIMHPLPRLTEISTDLDNDPRAVYFKQVENGIYMRMAVLDNIFYK